MAVDNSINTLATPLINRTAQQVELNATPKMKANLYKQVHSVICRDLSSSGKETRMEKTGSLELRLMLDTENDSEKKWNIDARRLSFTSPNKEESVVSTHKDVQPSSQTPSFDSPPKTPKKLPKKSKKRAR